MITSKSPFSPDQHQRLLKLADQMIPAVDEMPGAGDVGIFARVLEALVRHQALVIETLDSVDSLEDIQSAAPAFVQVFQNAVVASYYRDDRVLRNLGLPSRAPYPEGHEVGETDWSLLDPVRSRQPFYRQIDDD